MADTEIISTTSLHRDMPRVLERVAAGEEIGVTNWGGLVAWLVPPDGELEDEQQEVGRPEIVIEGVRWIPAEWIDPWDYPAAPIVGSMVVVASIVNDDARSPVGRVEQPDARGVHIRFAGTVNGVTTAHAAYGELRRPPQTVQ